MTRPSNRLASDSAAPDRTSAPPRETGVRASDVALVELLRANGSGTVEALAESLGVTSTAVRQRLDRLIREGVVCREQSGGAPSGRSRGRPAFVHRLTEKGRRVGGDNFRDLALVLWQEIRGIEAPEVRRGLVARIGDALARQYGSEVRGTTLTERIDEAAAIFRDRRIACSVAPADGASGGLAVLTTHDCPYPDLADRDRAICASERTMLEKLVGGRVRLAECRLDGADCCRFVFGQTAGRSSDTDGSAPRPDADAAPADDGIPTPFPPPLGTVN